MPSSARIFGVTALIAILATSTFADPPPWQYHAGQEDAGFIRPLYRSLQLSPAKPSELETRVDFRGEKQFYTMLRYGTPSSLRVGVVVDRIGRSDFDLYVDTNRDHVIFPKEKVTGTGKTRQLKLNAEFAEGEFGSKMLAREVIFRNGFLASSVSFATIGYLQGNVEFERKQVPTRRVDGNGDGLFSAARDRVWLDLNQDGMWDGFGEQFAYSPIITLSDQRYQMKSDPAGNRLSIERLTGSGQLKLKFDLDEEEASVVSNNVMFVGSDGSAFTIDAHENTASVPIGTYTIGVVRLVLRDSTGQMWTYVFSDSGHRKKPPVYVVTRDQSVEVDPIGELRFTFERESREGPVKANTLLGLKPQIFTGDGLLINSSHCGDKQPPYSYDNGAKISLRDGKSGERLHQTHSGFS